METQNRKQGGQPGNRNALRHGYYSKVFDTKEEKTDFCKAGDVKGIDEEIALIRYVIKTVANARDEKSLSILVRATKSLNRLMRTRQKLSGKYDNFNQVKNVVNDFLYHGYQCWLRLFSHGALQTLKRKRRCLVTINQNEHLKLFSCKKCSLKRLPKTNFYKTNTFSVRRISI